MKIRKSLAIALLLAFLFPVVSHAKDAVVKTEEGISVTYALNNTENIARVKGFAETVKKKITIPSKITVDGKSYTVTKIGAAAFKDSDFNTVSLPNTITLIEKEAFLNSWVKNCPLPPKVEKIGAYAFNNASLKSVTIPETCSEIGDHAFSMTTLESVTFADAWTRLAIGSFAFSGTSLTEITIPYRVVSIGDGAFRSTNIVNVVWPDRLKEIPKLCFSNCNFLRSVTIPFGVTSIGESAFSECEELTDVQFPTTLTTIGKSAFWRDGIKVLSLPEGVKSIGDNAFQTCPSLIEVNLPSTLESIGVTCFQGSNAIMTVRCNALVPPTCGASPFATPTFRNAKLIVPESVWQLYAYTDYWCAFNFDSYKNSGIESVGNDLSEKIQVGLFDLQGRPVKHPVKGQILIKVEKDKDGCMVRTKKVF